MTISSAQCRPSAFPLRMLLALSLGLLCLEPRVTGAPAFAAEVEILTPRSGSTVIARHPGTHLVLRRPAGVKASAVQVKAGDKPIEPFLAMEGEGGDYLHFRLPLVPDDNTFTIQPGGQRLELKYRPIKAGVPTNVKNLYLFHQDDRLPAACAGCHELHDGKVIERLGGEARESCASCHQNILGAARQHSPAATRLCLSCHQLSAKPWRIGFPPGSIEATCFACHTGKAAWRSRKYVHGPLNAGGCTLCHDPHGGTNRYFLWAEGSLALCIACHGDKESLVKKDGRPPYVHDLIPGMGCVVCHDPHATDNRFILNQPVNTLCVSCHSHLAEVKRGHPVGNHPVAAPRELRRPDRPLNCASCHDPHGSSYRYLLIGEPLEGRICRVCHHK